jgi:ribosomal protein S18 acetylase RimI-like enzyme
MSRSGDTMPGTITVYRSEMAAGVAAMFNAFNELWPGGFGGGIRYTEQRVRDWLDETSAVADLIALDAEGIPVGYCGVYPHFRDRHACYVTILGVVPRVQGYKFGKRLLLRAVELAIEHGFTRLDLHTWPGNLEAVPLYKKTGLFWVPETSVHMQNYLPGLARVPLAAAWFERHPDWYAAFDRELTQAPDDTTVDGMALYTYRFVAGEDELIGEIDRYGQGLCGIRSTLEGERLGIRTRLDSHELRMGMPNALTLLIDNGTERDLQLALAVEPFAGLTWERPFPLTLTAPRGQVTTIRRGLVIDK